MTGTPVSPDPTRRAGAAADDPAGPSLEARLADRTRDLDELTRQHAATVEILDIVARSPAGLQPALDAVVGAAVRHCGADDATMFLREGTEMFGAAHEGPLPSGFGNRRPIGSSPLDALIVRDGQTIHAPDTEALDPVEFASVIAVARQRGVRALVGAPIRHAGEVIGFLLLRRREVGPFTARQIATLETLATQAGVAVANAGVITELRQSLDQQTATAEVMQVINASPGDTTPVFEAILQKTHALCGIAYGSLQLYDGQKFRAVATHNLPEPLAMRLREGYVPGPRIRQLIDGVGFSQFPDIGLVDEPMAKAAAESGLKTLLSVALRKDGRLLGQIVCARKEVRPFTDREIALLQGFADQAVIAMENARLITETRDALDRQTAMAEVLAAINANPGELAPVFDTILEKAHRLCGSAIGNLSLYDGARLRRVAFRGMSGETSAMVAEPRSISDLHGRLVRGERFVHVADLDAADAPRTESLTALRDREGIRSFVLVPLRREGAFLGYISANWAEPRSNVAGEVALLESFADQAVIGIENARLLREQREALERQTAMAEVLTVINASPGDLTPVFSTILDRALSLSGSSFGFLDRFDGEKFWQVAERNVPPALADIGLGGHVPEAGTLQHRLVLGDDVAHLADITDDEAYRAGVPSRVVMADEAGARSMLIVALRKDGQLLGAIQIYRTEVRAFSEAEVALVRAFADQAVIAIENARLLREQREALERQTAMAEVLAVINASPGDLTPVFSTILDKALSLSRSSFGILFRFDGEKFWLLAERNIPPALAGMGLGGHVPEAGTLLHRMVLGDDVAHLADITDDEAYRAGMPSRVIMADQGGARSALMVALRKDGRLLGGIQVYRAEVRAFSEAEVTLVRSFADQAVIAMENARLLTETKEALERQTAMAEVLEVISNSVEDTQPVFEKILESCQRLIECTDLAVLTIEADALVHVRAARGPHAWLTIEKYRPVPVGQSVIARAVEKGETVHIRDSLEDDDVPEVNRRLAARFGNLSCLIAPLIWRGRCIGAMHVARSLKERNWPSFTDKDISLLEAFADYAVIAMENARLIAETRESLERQTAMAEVLAAINANPGELTPVFDTILDKALSLSGSSIGMLVRFDGEKGWLVAGRNVPLAVGDVGLGGFIPAAGTLFHRMVLGDDVAFLADIRDDEAYRAGVPQRVILADEGGARSLLTVALRKDGRLLGGIQVYRTEVRAFSEAEVTLVRSFADQAVIAMENARLLTETREALEQQTATAEVLRVINASPGDLEPVFEAILAKAHDLCGATMGSLNLFDGGMNRAVATRGMDDAFSDFLRRGTPMSGVLSREHSVQVADLVELARQDPDNPVWRAATELGGVRTMLGVPLVKDGNVLGRIVAARREVRPFTESQIALLENFAAQAVIAMENARLLEQIRQRQAELRVTFDNMGDGVAMFDAEPRLAAWNRNFERIVGVPEDRLTDRPSYAQYLLLLAERGEFGTENVEAELASRLEDTERELRLERTRADGTVIEVRRNAVPGGGFVLIYSDITQRRKAEAAIRAARDAAEAALERQTATADILKVIAGSPTDVQPVLEAVVNAAVRFCGAADAIILIRDGDGMISRAHEGPLSYKVGDILSLDRRSAVGRAIVDVLTCHLPDTETLDSIEFANTRRLAALYGFRAVVAAPLKREDIAIGAVVLRKVEPGPFTPQQIELLETFAAQAVIAIENVRLFTELRESLERLKAAQANLVQSEKMASLGQLTAGIAHEIKNPLNFVNNFAGLSIELLAEIREVAAPAFAQLDEDKRAEIDETMALITGNLEKIAEHGKRADGIVRSMLSHSRGGTGDWQATDINALVEEALNLAFHGARAQDKNFNITLERDLAPTSKPIEVVPQDVTRVFLNLFGNGFYAANKRRMAGTEAGFKPLLRVSTRDLGETVEIKVRDNGTGIPDEVRAKLFQPFFTTKPTGEGTGLGLSISYDIVTQQHGGTIEVESEVGSFTEFTVHLPRRRRTAPAERTG